MQDNKFIQKPIQRINPVRTRWYDIVLIVSFIICSSTLFIYFDYRMSQHENIRKMDQRLKELHAKEKRTKEKADKASVNSETTIAPIDSKN